VRYTAAIVRPPSANFDEGVTEADLGKPDYDLAMQQHSAYCEALRRAGVDVIALAPDPKFPDACFVEDTAIVIDEGAAVITRPGHPARRGEEKAVADVLAKFKKTNVIEEPGTVDGGDVMRIGDHFFIGLSARTNQSGAEKLSAILNKHGKTSSTFDVENYIHLKTALSPIDSETMLCLEDYAVPQRQRCKFFSQIKRVISVPAAEHWAANCLSVNDHVLVPQGCLETAASLEKLGKKVIALDMSEFQKMDGRLTCLSILL